MVALAASQEQQAQSTLRLLGSDRAQARSLGIATQPPTQLLPAMVKPGVPTRPGCDLRHANWPDV